MSVSVTMLLALCAFGMMRTSQISSITLAVINSIPQPDACVRVCVCVFERERACACVYAYACSKVCIGVYLRA
jgi:hypothetical protein